MEEYIVLQIKTTGNVKQDLERRMKDFPQMTRNAMRAWGKMALVPGMRNGAKAAGILSKGGKFFSNMRWQQEPKSNIGKMMMPMEGIYLDRMIIHRLWFTKYSPAKRLNWGIQAQLGWINQKAAALKRGKGTGLGGGFESKFFIWVHPHPFIQKSYLAARRKLPTYLRTYGKLPV